MLTEQELSTYRYLRDNHDNCVNPEIHCNECVYSADNGCIFNRLDARKRKSCILKEILEGLSLSEIKLKNQKFINDIN